MSRSAGSRLGPYEIVAPLGAGGMGEVYRARDARLKREVAVKVLRDQVTHSPDRRQRFESEARAASALNHPNILTLHDIGEEEGEPYIVFELLDGQTLGSLMKAGPLSVRSLLEIATQVADGLAAAHAAGITHRDLKPDNLFVLRDGRVKILDFGLAKHTPAVDPEGETLADSLTQSGMVLGTTAYMSPEQTQGRRLDFRSDQFSFGTILYEMATGRRPFKGADRESLMSAIAGEEPPALSSVNPRIPAPLRWIIERCLAKEPERRFGSSADLHQRFLDLRDHLSEVSTDPSALAPARPRHRWPRTALLVVAAAASGVAAARMIGGFDPWPGTPYDYRPFATESIDEMQPAWSPDGQTLAYIGVSAGIGQVYARALDSTHPAQITSSRATCRDPFWSPDGTHIYYRSEGSLWSVGAAGGTPELVVQNIAEREVPASISPDGKVLASFRPDGLRFALNLIPLGGGEPTVYRQPPFDATVRIGDGLRFSPDGRKLAASILRDVGEGATAELWIISFPGGGARLVPLALSPGTRFTNVSWLPDNVHCVLSVERMPGDGRHLHLLDTNTGDMHQLTSGVGEESQPAVSPDGRKIAFANVVEDVDLMELSADGQATVLLATARRESEASWAPSGKQFVYVSTATGASRIWLRSVGENWARPIADVVGGARQEDPALSPDGQRVAWLNYADRHSLRVSHVSGGRSVPLENETDDQHHPAWSPDGAWIAYRRFASQKWEIAKVRSGGGDRPVRVCEAGSWSSEPADVLWSASGDSIWFQDDQGIRQVPASGGVPRHLHPSCAAFTLSRDQRTLYVIRRRADRRWQLAALNAGDGKEIHVVPLSIGADKEVRDLAPGPRGEGFVVTVADLKRDIWILDGLSLEEEPLRRFWPH